MSTTFTKPANVSLPSLTLGQSLVNAHQWVTQSLINLMAERGYANLTSAHLTFMNNLNCGETHASAIARRMGISRQAVYRTTRELQKLRVLTLIPDPNDRRQKIILMTTLGNKIAIDARADLVKIEAALAKQIGQKDMAKLSSILRQDLGPYLGI